MVPSTVVGLLVLVVAVLPGAVYTWAFERQASAYGVTLADRTLRFVAVSVIFHVAFAWPEYGLYRLTLAGSDGLAPRQFGLLWGGALLLVAIPATLGTVVGGLYATRTTRTGWRWIRGRLSPERETRVLRALLGRDPSPRAWDDLFSERPTAYLRVKTTDDTWVAGLFAARSYAGGFPHDADLLLEEAWSMADDGSLGDQGLGYAVYMPASRVAVVEIVPEPSKEDDDVEV